MLKVSSGSAANCLRCKYGCYGFGFIFCLCFISGVAGFLPVVSWVLMDKWLIINGIRFCRLCAFAGSFLSEPLIYLILLILMIWVAGVLCFWAHIGFIVHFCSRR